MQTTNDGSLRMLTVIKDASAPTSYAYNVRSASGGTISINPDGSAAVKNGSNVLAYIPAPWATDATGKSIQTEYTTDGTTLTQDVAHNVVGVTYPVIADPTVTFGWSIYFRYSKTEVKQIRAHGPLIGYGVAYGIVCTKVPNQAYAAGCAVSMGVAYWAIDKTFDAAAAENKCVEVRMDYTGGLDGWKRYRC